MYAMYFFVSLGTGQGTLVLKITAVGEKCDCPESQIDVDYSDVKPSISNKDIQKGGMINDKATSIDGR